MNKTFFDVKSPVQRTRHCWMLHVPSVYTPCCMLLLVVWSCCAKFETGQKFEPTTPYISFVPWPPKRGARTLDPFSQLFQHFWGHARAKMAAECNFTKSNGLYHSHDVLQVHRKVVASVCTCCPSCAETEEGQLSRDVRYCENYHFQNEARCETFLVKMSYICMKIKNSCYINSYDFSLALNQRLEATRKWSIGLAVLSAVCPLRDHVTVSMSSVYEDGKHREMGSIGEMLWLLKDLLIQRLTTLNYWIFAHFRSRSSTGATFRVQDDCFTSTRKLASTVGKRIQLWFPTPAW